MNSLIMKLLIVLGPIMALLLVAALIPENMWNRVDYFGGSAESKARRNDFLRRKDAALLGLFKLFDRLPLIRVYTTNVSFKLKRMYINTDEDSDIATGNLLFYQLLAAIVLPYPFWMYFGDLILMMIGVVIVEYMIYVKVIGDGYRFLGELAEFPGDLVHVYNAEGNNMDATFKRLINDGGYLVRYVSQMYSYINRAVLSDSSEAIDEYNRVAPSRYLRIIFNYIYLTVRYGDYDGEDGQSLFNRNVLAIQREIHSEYTKITRIKDGSFGNLFMILMPYFLIPIMFWFVGTYFTFDGFEQVFVFIHSGMGYAAKIACGLVTLACFFFYYKGVINFDVMEKATKINLDEEILTKYRGIGRLVEKLIPKPDTKSYARLKQLVLVDSGVVSLKPLYLRRVYTALFVFVVITGLIVTDKVAMDKRLENNVYVGVEKSLMDTIALTSDNPEQYLLTSVENDKKVIKLLSKHKKEYKKLSTAEKKEMVTKNIDLSGVDYGMYKEVAIDRITEKYNIISNDSSNIVLILVIIGLVVLGYMYPVIAMYIRQYTTRGMLLHTDVIGCYTIVILLLRHPSSNIKMIFEWLTGFSTIFKSKMQMCLDHLNDKSISKLDEDVEYKPFKRLVECLLLSEKGSALRDAFAGIEQRHRFQEEERDIINDKVVKQRVTIAETLSAVSLAFTFTVLVLIPMSYAILDMAIRLGAQYKGMK